MSRRGARSGGGGRARGPEAAGEARPPPSTCRGPSEGEPAPGALGGGARAGKKGHAGRKEGREREREREGGRAHLGDPNTAITITGAPRAQGRRERWKRLSCAWEN
jgi:hypothetical protein